MHDFYVNVLMKSAKEMLEEKLGHGFGGKIATRQAQKLLTPARLAKKMGPEFAKQVPKDLAEEGVSATASCELIRGPFIVLKVTILEVDMHSIVEKVGAESEGAGKIGSCILSCLPPEMLQKVQSELLADVFASKLVEMMGPEMQRQTSEHGVEVEAHGMPPHKQGQYLLQALAIVKEGHLEDE